MGRPAVLVATLRFVGLAREVSAGYGLPSARIAMIEHPLGGVAEQVVIERANSAVEQVIALLTGAGR